MDPSWAEGSFFYHLVKVRDNISFTSFLSDSNCELINAYDVVRYNIEKLIESLKRHEDLYYNNPKDYYYDLRSTTCEDNIEKASRFITLNKTCFNGLYRVNRNGRKT